MIRCGGPEGTSCKKKKNLINSREDQDKTTAKPEPIQDLTVTKPGPRSKQGLDLQYVLQDLETLTHII